MDKKTAWVFLRVDGRNAPRVADAPARPYGAVVVASDFDKLMTANVSPLCVWLVATGCTYASFFGRNGSIMENAFDQAGVLVGLAVAGDEGSLQVLGQFWSPDIARAAANRARSYPTLISTSHDPDAESLEELFEGFATWNSDAFEIGIAVALDAASATATRNALRDSGLRTADGTLLSPSE